jgi:hypothetical protein
MSPFLVSFLEQSSPLFMGALSFGKKCAEGWKGNLNAPIRL